MTDQTSLTLKTKSYRFFWYAIEDAASRRSSISDVPWKQKNVGHRFDRKNNYMESCKSPIVNVLHWMDRFHLFCAPLTRQSKSEDCDIFNVGEVLECKTRECRKCKKTTSLSQYEDITKKNEIDSWYTRIDVAVLEERTLYFKITLSIIQ